MTFPGLPITVPNEKEKEKKKGRGPLGGPYELHEYFLQKKGRKKGRKGRWGRGSIKVFLLDTHVRCPGKGKKKKGGGLQPCNNYDLILQDMDSNMRGGEKERKRSAARCFV